MLIYFTTFLIIITTFHLSTKSNRIVSSLFYAISFLFTVLFSGLRGLVGADTPAYLAIYDSIKSAPALTQGFMSIEPGFYFFTLVHAKIFGSELFYLLSISILQGALLFSCIKRSAMKTLLLTAYLFIFYIESHFNTLRAGISSLFLLLSVSNRDDRKSWLFYFLALSFHYSSIVFLPIIMIRYGKKIALYSIGLVAFLIAFFYFNMDYIQYKFIMYEGFTVESSNGLSIVSIMYLSLMLFSFISFRNLKPEYYVSGIILSAAYFLYNWIPMTYRIVAIGALIYFYFLLEEVNFRRKEFTITSIFLLYFSWHSYTALSLVSNWEETLRRKISAGNIMLIPSLDSLYIPYKFYWAQ